MKKQKCHFCDESDCLEEHHIVPRRFDGSDKEENLVTVCPTCHRKLEDLYDDSFYEKLAESLTTVTSKNELEEYREMCIMQLKTSESERLKGFLYAVEKALGIDPVPWEKRSESFTPVKFNDIEGETLP